MPSEINEESNSVEIEAPYSLEITEIEEINEAKNGDRIENDEECSSVHAFMSSAYYEHGDGEIVSDAENNTTSILNAIKRAVLFSDDQKQIWERILLVTIGSYLGVGLRIGILMVSGNPNFNYTLGNFLGTAVLSFIWKNAASITYRPVFIGIATGFCGSLTTFSQWGKSAGETIDARNTIGLSTLQIIFLWVEIILIGICVALISWDFGKQLKVVEWAIKSCRNNLMKKNHYDSTNNRISKKYDRVLHLVPCVSFIGFVLVIVAFAVLAGLTGNRVTISLALAPAGALVRWRLSEFNQVCEWFPIGTFVANFLACFLVAISYGLGLYVESGTTQCNVLNGFSEGFCGSLSTVSSWVLELRVAKSTNHAYIYGTASILSTSIIYLAVIGGFVASNAGQNTLIPCI